MAKTLKDAQAELDKEFHQVRKHLGDIREAFDRVEKAGPEDDLYDMLDELEDAVSKARKGGILGSGAKAHRDALKELRELQNPKL